jgi:hypothetical protein
MALASELLLALQFSLFVLSCLQSRFTLTFCTSRNIRLNSLPFCLGRPIQYPFEELVRLDLTYFFFLHFSSREVERDLETFPFILC